MSDKNERQAFLYLCFEESRNVEYSELPRDSTEVCAKDEKLSDEDIEVESRLEDYSFECIMVRC